MEFDREGEFDRLMEEVVPISIPSSYIKNIIVKMNNGKKV